MTNTKKKKKGNIYIWVELDWIILIKINKSFNCCWYGTGKFIKLYNNSTYCILQISLRWVNETHKN